MAGASELNLSHSLAVTHPLAAFCPHVQCCHTPERGPRGLLRSGRAMSLSELYQQAPIGLCYFDADLHYVYINDWLASINGLTVQQHLGQRIGDILPDVAVAVEPQLRQVIETGEPIIRGKAYVETPAHPGSRRHYEHSYHPDESDDGTIMGVTCVIQDVTSRIMAEEALKQLNAELESRVAQGTAELRRSHEDLRRLGVHLESVREEERTRIARDLHDDLGQALTAATMDLDWIIDQLRSDQEPLGKRARGMMALLGSAMDSVRRITTELHPSILANLGLTEAMKWQLREISTRTGIAWELRLDDDGLVLEKERTIALFRIFQEALTNVVRHAGATRVEVRLAPEDGALVLSVSDDGRGIPEAELSRRDAFGLMGMRERALAHGGDVMFSSVPKQGTTVRVRMPLGDGEEGSIS